MISTWVIKPKWVRNDKYETYQTGMSQEWYVRDLSNQKDPGMLSSELIKSESAWNDMYVTYQTGKSLEW